MRAPAAGNTVDTLRPVDVNVAAATAPEPTEAPETESISEMHRINAELESKELEEFEEKFEAAASEYAEDEPVSLTEDFVTRDEYKELLARIERFNARSGQHI